jgi:hypothetical protein
MPVLAIQYDLFKEAGRVYEGLVDSIQVQVSQLSADQLQTKCGSIRIDQDVKGPEAVAEGGVSDRRALRRAAGRWGPGRTGAGGAASAWPTCVPMMRTAPPAMLAGIDLTKGFASPRTPGPRRVPGRPTQAIVVQGFARLNVMRTFPDLLLASNAAGRPLSRSGALSHVVSVSPSRA